jgi:DNA/RNA-binding domain of Phe-tRNA-synthetase-like protein
MGSKHSETGQARLTVPLPNACFRFLLTAGHDWEAVPKPVKIDIGEVHGRYARLNGEEQQLKPGDMMIADGQGIISCVLYGPDRRTRITSETREALFTVYAAPGIGEQALREYLKQIRANVSLIAPEADVGALAVYGTERS